MFMEEAITAALHITEEMPWYQLAILAAVEVTPAVGTQEEDTMDDGSDIVSPSIGYLSAEVTKVRRMVVYICTVCHGQ